MKKHWIAAISGIALIFTIGSAKAQFAITGATDDEPEERSESADNTASKANQAGGDTDTRLAAFAEEYKYAVGAVVMVVPGRGAVPLGTAWAFGETSFATNAHVAGAILEYRKKSRDLQFYVAVNQRPDKRLRIENIKVHPKYQELTVRFDGRATRNGYDVAILTTADKAPATFKLASTEKLKSLKSGRRIAFLGFPTESLAQGNIDAQIPIATMQSGIVTSVSDHLMGDSGFEGNRLVRHNLASAGGASGSPIFDADGDVVAILWGGNINLGIDIDLDNKKQIIRQPSAALVNFAERIDSLKELSAR